MLLINVRILLPSSFLPPLLPPFPLSPSPSLSSSPLPLPHPWHSALSTVTNGDCDVMVTDGGSRKIRTTLPGGTPGPLGAVSQPLTESQSAAPLTGLPYLPSVGLANSLGTAAPSSSSTASRPTRTPSIWTSCSPEATPSSDRALSPVRRNFTTLEDRAGMGMLAGMLADRSTRPR